MPRQKSDHVDSAAALAARLRQARERAGLSQRSLARGICTPAYISRLEKGERIPSLQLLRRLAERLGAHADELAAGSRPVDDPLLAAELTLRLGANEDVERAFHAVLDRGDRALRVRALRGLGAVAAARGEHQAAIELLETAAEADEDAVAEPLGRAYALGNELDAAIAVFERALEAARGREDPVDTVRFAVLLASALIDADRVEHAAAVLEATIAAAADSHDSLALARLWWTQSRNNERRADADGAGRYARLALAALELNDHTAYAARAHELLARVGSAAVVQTDGAE